jgi:hypothetical protein
MRVQLSTARLPPCLIPSRRNSWIVLIVVFSQNKCAEINVPKVRAMADSVTGPVLDELVREGKLTGWGMLGHLWGDEWNVNVWYSAPTQRAFLDSWDELLKRTSARHPGWYAQFVVLCSEHKDSMYSVWPRR